MAEKLAAASDAASVQVSCFTRTRAIPQSEEYEGFPVLVRVKAPGMEHLPRANVDMVAVLDISGSMKGDRLERVKEAMTFVINKLSTEDRLAIVPFNGNLVGHTGLMNMSGDGRRQALDKVNHLQAGGGTRLEPGLTYAAQILNARDDKDRVGCIILLSDGDDEFIFNQTISAEFPVHTFGFSDNHDANAMLHIADESKGTYSFIDDANLLNIKDAFAMCMGGLTSVVTLNTHLNLKATQLGVTISSIESEPYKSHINTDKRSGSIDIDVLYADEEKNFIVYLDIPKEKQSFLASLFGGSAMDLLILDGSYTHASSKADCALNGSNVSIKRPVTSTDEDKKISPEVATEIVRRRVMEGVARISDNRKQLPPTAQEFQRIWKSIENSDEGRAAKKEQMKVLENDINQMPKNNNFEGSFPYMLSWLTSHKWQRATTKGSPCTGSDFQTPRMQNIVKEANMPLEKVIPDEVPKVPFIPPKKPERRTCTCARLVDKARKNPCEVLAFVAVLVSLAVLFHFSLCWFGLVGNTMQGETQSIVTTTTTTTMTATTKKDVDLEKLQRRLPLLWSKMAVAFEKVEDTELTAFFQESSAETINRAMHQYLYLAVVHASALGRRYATIPEDVVSKISTLELQVENLEGEKKMLAAELETLVQEKEEAIEKASTKCVSQENEEAIERANTRIAELERQLQDKKAFADSLLSEVAKQDAHLKTCGERVGMLESRVQELESTAESN